MGASDTKVKLDPEEEKRREEDRLEVEKQREQWRLEEQRREEKARLEEDQRREEQRVEEEKARLEEEQRKEKWRLEDEKNRLEAAARLETHAAQMFEKLDGVQAHAPIGSDDIARQESSPEMRLVELKAMYPDAPDELLQRSAELPSIEESIDMVVA